MPILICGILDGVMEAPREGSITIVEGEMTAVGYGLESLACLDDEATMKRIVEQYKRVNADYFSDHTLVPLQFGNIVDSKDEVRQFLINAGIQLKALIDKVKGRIEITIRVSFDVPKVIAEISKNVDTTDKIAAGKALFELSQEHKTAVGQVLKAKLSRQVADHVEMTGDSEAVILHNSYLVERAKEGHFNDALDKAAEACADFLVFDYVGPIPPYNFVSAEFNKGQFELINEARLVLGLEDRCTFDQIRSRYRKISLEVHPDRNEGEDREMKALNEAYRIVRAYCNSVNESEYFFTREAIEQSFVHY